MNANSESKASAQALSFTGGGATIANTFSLALALGEIKKAICILFLFSAAWPVSLPAYL